MKQLNDQYFNYRQTPVDYDGVAKPSIKGNTLVWNQLVDSGTSSVALTSGHIYITKVGTAWSRVSGTGQSISVTGGSDCVFDLTKMFGSGNEPTTVEEFTSFFPLPYYAYNSGSLLNFNGSGIKTTGDNLLGYDGENLPYSANNVSITRSDNVYHVVANNPTGYPFARIYTFSYLKKGSYTVTMLGADSNHGIAWRLIDRNVSPAVTYVNSSSEITNNIVISEDLFNVYFEITIDSTRLANGTYDLRFQLEFGSSASTYEPYHTETTTLPISTYFPTGMKSAGTGTSKVYDELNDKATTRVGTITFDGTQTTVQTEINSTQCRVIYAVSDIKGKTMTTAEVDYGLTSNYLSNTANSNTYDGQPGIHRRVGGQQQIFVSLGKDSGISNITEWNTYLSAHPLQVNYELATYTEQDVDPIYYNFYGNGTEQLLPVNTDTPTTSPLLADIIYYNLTDSEVPYRVFWAINSKGERWDFTEREFKSFMNNPQGLGFSKTISVNRYGNVQNLTDITDNFPQPNGEVLFYDSSNSTRYDKYNQFVKFLSYEPITLYYKIPVSFYSRIPNTYSLECVVGTLTKTESKTDNMMNCSITYNALSFYKGEEVEISGTGLTYTINNDGDFPVGFEIEINATYNFYMKNPYIQLSQDGSLYGEAKFIDDTRFNKVYINSKDGEQNVILQQSGSVLPNPMSYQDLSISNGSIYVTFVKLARGETTLTIGADSQNITDVTIKYTPIYRSV